MSAARKRPRASQSRAILALDLDCFYAQVAIRSRPHLANRPVVIVQKHLCVTSNYVARRLAHGAVQKMTPVSTALKACPDIVCIDGSDLTPFREANAEVLAVIRAWLHAKVAGLGVDSFPIPCQKLGFDEVFIDVSRLVAEQVTAGGRPWEFQGHIFGRTDDDASRRALMVASQLASELRKEITLRTKLTLCAGISESKLLAKLAVNMNKPNDQTIFLSEDAAQYVAGRHPRSLPGFGHAVEGKISAWAKRNGKDDIKTAADVVQWFGDGKKGFASLARVLGNDDQARKILELCQGTDTSPVIESGDAPKSLTSMDSFRSCTKIEDAERRVAIRAKDMVTRLRRDWELYGRQPTTLTVGFRFRGDGYHAKMRAIPMPQEIVSLCSSKGADAADRSIIALTRATLFVLKDHAGVSASSTFDMTLISIGASAFTENKTENATSTKKETVASFFAPKKGKGMPSVCRPPNGRLLQNRSSPNPRRPLSPNASCSRCPICDQVLSSRLAKASVHVDQCLRRSETVSPARKRSKTASNTLRVDSFFQRK